MGRRIDESGHWAENNEKRKSKLLGINAGRQHTHVIFPLYVGEQQQCSTNPCETNIVGQITRIYSGTETAPPGSRLLVGG